MDIAWYNYHTSLGCRTLIATHYLQLAKLALRNSGKYQFISYDDRERGIAYLYRIEVWIKGTVVFAKVVINIESKQGHL